MASFPAADRRLMARSGLLVGAGSFFQCVSSRDLFRRRFLEELLRAHRAGQLQFFAECAPLTDARAFADWLAPLLEQL